MVRIPPVPGVCKKYGNIGRLGGGKDKNKYGLDDTGEIQGNLRLENLLIFYLINKLLIKGIIDMTSKMRKQIDIFKMH